MPGQRGSKKKNTPARMKIQKRKCIEEGVVNRLIVEEFGGWNYRPGGLSEDQKCRFIRYSERGYEVNWYERCRGKA